jgi:hypothetical protein
MTMLDNVEKLLKKADIKYTREEDILITRWKTEHYEDLKVKIAASNDGSWLYVVAPFTNIDQVSEDVREDFLYKMLKESWKANGVKYVLDDDSDIVVISETGNSNLKSEELQMIINHVVHACDILWEIHP